MLKRSDVRLCAYRKQADSEPPKNLSHLIPIIEDIMLEGDTWKNFLTVWDMVVKDGSVVRIATEKDLQFAVSTCIEIKTKISMGMLEEDIVNKLDERQKNIYDIVKLNYLGPEVDWEKFNISWELKFDSSGTRIEVLSKKTKINTLTPPKKKPLGEAIKTEKGSIEDLDPKLLSKIKELLKTK